jgi:serine protease Do
MAMCKSLMLSIVALILAVVAVSFAASTRLSSEGRPTNVAATPAAGIRPADRADPSDAMASGLFRTIAKRENPIVVAITTQSRIKAPPRATQLSDSDDFFWRFFGGPRAPREQIQQSLGSGFLIGSKEIVTNNHVVAGADQIRVALFGDDRKTYPAQIVGRDPLTDSALISLKDGPTNLRAATLCDSDALEPGDWVMAIGNPFQLGHTVTVGVISYKGRPFATTEGRFQNMLQTDASINPGNSGGPLINVSGDVIGVNSAILSGDGNGGNIGIGFAVPINTIKDLLPQLRKGMVHRGRLGVQIVSTPISDDEAKGLGLSKPEGAIVSRVEPDSPADRAGLHAGDVIVEYDGKPVADADHLTALVVATPAGSRVSVGFYRDGRRQATTATVEELNLDDKQSDRRSDRGSAQGFGLSLGDVTPEIADQLRLPAGTHGAVVENVEPFTPAANGGVKRGDVMLEVDRRAVHSAREATRALGATKSGQPAFLLLSRQGVQLFVELKKE